MKNQKDLKLFQTARTLEFISMDVFGPLPKTAHEKQHVIVVTDWFPKPMRSIPLRTITASVVTNAFLYN